MTTTTAYCSPRRRTYSGPVKATPVIRYVSLDEVRGEVARFEAAHPGIGADNHPDAFRDANGELVETEEFFRISGHYSVLAAHGE